MNSTNRSSTRAGETEIMATKSTEPSKQHRDSVIALIVKLASAMNVELSVHTQGVYYQKLKNSKLEYLTHAIDTLIDTWTQPHTIPPVATILEHVRQAHHYGPTITDSRRILDRGDKPPDWEALKPGEFDQMRKAAAERAQQIQDQIANVVEQKQMPSAGEIGVDEWNRRRDAQLRRFRTNNPGAGEA